MATIIVGGRGPYPYDYHEEFEDLEPPTLGFGRGLIGPPLPPLGYVPPAVPFPDYGDPPPPPPSPAQKFGGMAAIGLGVGVLVIFSLLLTRKQ